MSDDKEAPSESPTGRERRHNLELRERLDQILHGAGANCPQDEVGGLRRAGRDHRHLGSPVSQLLDEVDAALVVLPDRHDREHRGAVAEHLVRFGPAQRNNVFTLSLSEFFRYQFQIAGRCLKDHGPALSIGH